MYCSCGARNGFSAPRETDAEFDYESVWVCSDCHLPTRMVFDVTTNRRVPIGAKAMLSTHSHTDGTCEVRWDMGGGERKVTLVFLPYPRKVPAMENTDSLLYQCWQLLDSEVDIILRPIEGPGDNDLQKIARDEAKLRARGVANTIALLMRAFYANGNAVVKEAVRRHQARMELDGKYESPGLAEHLWDPNLNWDGSPRQPVAQPKSRPVAAPKKKAPPKAGTGTELPAGAAEGIKEALASGMFSVADIAGMFKVTVDTVEQLKV